MDMMKTIYSENTKLHNPTKEFISHNLIEYAESPDRMSIILEALKWIKDIEIVAPNEFSLEEILKVHSPQYIAYLQTAYENWVSAGLNPDGVMPDFFATGNIRKTLISKSPIGQAGFFMTDLSTMIVGGTFTAAKYSAFSALTAAKFLLSGEPSVFSLGRPPGHHAGYEFCGGYCFLNNAAIAAKYLQDHDNKQDGTLTKVCILDVDYHHGNGTQDIVQRQQNMLYVSIHGHPDSAYPYLTGFVDENSDKSINFPLKENITNSQYFEVLREAVAKIKLFNPDYFIISFGVDTHEFENEDLGDFRLTTDFYKTISGFLREELPIPTLILMEGGYKISVLGANVCNFLESYL